MLWWKGCGSSYKVGFQHTTILLFLGITFYLLNVTYECCRFKIEIKIEYNDQVELFMFWDQQRVLIIGMNVIELRNIMKEISTMSFLFYYSFLSYNLTSYILWLNFPFHPKKTFQAHLDKHLDKEFSFASSINHYSNNARLSNLFDDEDVIKNMKDYMNPIEINFISSHCLILC